MCLKRNHGVLYHLGRFHSFDHFVSILFYLLEFIYNHCFLCLPILFELLFHG